jgi:hypothetical protein
MHTGRTRTKVPDGAIEAFRRGEWDGKPDDQDIGPDRGGGRDGGRRNPKAEKGRFGMRITYGPTMQGEMLTWVRWYRTERARDQAIAGSYKRGQRIVANRYSFEPVSR